MEFLEEAYLWISVHMKFCLQYWKNIITQCQSRPTGQTVKQLMAEHGINAKTYYLWQRKIRQETFALIQKPSQTLLTKEEKGTCFA